MIVKAIGKVLAVIFIAGLFLFGLQAILEPTIQHRMEKERRETLALSDILIFPEGWTPVACEDREDVYNGCYWVCVRDSIYRYCKPTIQTSMADPIRTEVNR